MRTNFRFFGIALGILLGMPAWAQVESIQQQTTTAPVTQEQAPAIPTLQDVRGPLNTISNRPRAATGAQPGAAAGAGQAGLTPGARTAFPGSDLQLRIQEFQFQQLQEDLQAEQRERNEFQQFVMQSIGRDLPMFGSNLFRTVPSTFAPVDNIPVAADYVVGPGDEIQIRAWGQIDVDYNAAVERDGTISVPKVGVINVAGIKASDLPAYLKTVFGRTFRNFDINVNIGQLRSIQIFIVGEAKRPGSYTISSLSTLVNALFASGGPAPLGSMRRIQVKRAGEVVTAFDLYDLLLKGDKSKDVPLVSGDVIYIPPVGPMVALAGSVDVPALYELKTESTIKDVLALAGGLSTLAQDKEIRVERIVHHNSRSVLDVKLDATGLATPLSDGDILEITPIIDRFKDAVTLRGNVADPRRFAWFPGMRIRDLIPDKDALLTRDYWQQRNQLGLPVLDSTPDVRRYAPDSPVAQVYGVGVGPTKTAAMLGLPNTQGLYTTPDSDTNVYSINAPFGSGAPLLASDNAQSGTSQSSNTNSSASNSSTANTSSIGDLSSDGNSKTSRTGALSSQDTRNDSNSNNASISSVSTAVTGTSRRFPPKNAVVLSAPEVDWAYAVVQRLNRHDLTSQLLPFNLGRAVLDGDNTQNLELEPGDVVTIFSKADIRVPQSQQTKYVRLEGEFVAAGTYSISPGETLRQLVVRAGGKDYPQPAIQFQLALPTVDGSANIWPDIDSSGLIVQLKWRANHAAACKVRDALIQSPLAPGKLLTRGVQDGRGGTAAL